MAEQETKGTAKVTVKPPAVVKDILVTDALGRVIRLKKPGPLANLDFAKAAGSDKLNVLYLAEVMHLKFVEAIDNQRVTTPSTEGELRALYLRLGDEGNEAVMKGVTENFLGDGATNSQEAELKNS